MPERLTIIHPYFENGAMFELQQQAWAKYPADVKARTRFIVVDDCSSEDPAERHVRHELCNSLQLYRITKKVPWNWLACRNLAAKQAEDGSWLLLTDMDHLVCGEVAGSILRALDDLQVGPDRARMFFTPARVDAEKAEPYTTPHGLQPYKPHPNSYLMLKELYWKIGGYDEDYSGNYGTDGMYRKRCLQHAAHVEIPQELIRFAREVVGDASTTKYPRKEGRDPDAKRKVAEWKASQGIEGPRTGLFPWERLI